MGVLSKFESSFVNAKVNIPEKIKLEDELKLPKIVLQDERKFIPSREEKSMINALMVAHNIEEYRRSKIEIILLPKVDIEISKILEINREELRMKKIERLR